LSEADQAHCPSTPRSGHRRPVGRTVPVGSSLVQQRPDLWGRFGHEVHHRTLTGWVEGPDHPAHRLAVRLHYPMDQDAALLWYHDHRMDFSAPQVWRGLAGMFVIRDDHEDALDLPAGDQELLLTLTDRSFGTDGELLYPALDDTLTQQPGAGRVHGRRAG